LINTPAAVQPSTMLKSEEPAKLEETTHDRRRVATHHPA
jgi:hypothetical protein